MDTSNSTIRQFPKPADVSYPVIGDKPLQASASVVYVHRRRDTGEPFYVGIGSVRRAHSFSLSARNDYWHKVVAKSGKPAVDIVAQYSDRKDAEAHEVRLIAEFTASGFRLTNLTLGGEKNKVWSLESKVRLSEAVRAKFLDSEYRDRVSRGVKQSYIDNPDARTRASERTKIQMQTTDFKDKHSTLVTELWKDPEYRKKIQVRQVEGRTESHWAQRHSETMKKVWEGRSEEMSARAKALYADPVKREKMLKDRIRPVAAYTKDGALHAQYASVAEAADAVGVSRSCIVAAAKKNVKTSAGFVWEYVAKL